MCNTIWESMDIDGDRFVIKEPAVTGHSLFALTSRGGAYMTIEQEKDLYKVLKKRRQERKAGGEFEPAEVPTTQKQVDALAVRVKSIEERIAVFGGI